MIRVVTYNVGGAQDLDAAASVMAALDADVVCLTAAPDRRRLLRLARRCELDVAARAGRASGRAALLVGRRGRTLSAETHGLRELPGLPRRAVAQAIVSVDGSRVAVFAVQLGLHPEARSLRTDDLLEVLERFHLPSIVGASLNEAPGGPAGTRLAERLTDAFAAAGEGPGETFPAGDALVRKDYVFVDPDLKVRRAFVPSDAATRATSHHLPVVAELDAPAPDVGEETAGETVEGDPIDAGEAPL